MATVLPFRGTRYNTERVGSDISSLVCPSADAIPPARRKVFHDRHPYNFCRIVAPLSAQAPSPRTQAGGWLSDGILMRDSSPSFYLLSQTFTATVGGVDDRFTRLGLIVELEYDAISDSSLLTPFNDIQTSFGSISDSEGTRFLVEPSLLTYNDPHRTIVPLLQEAMNSVPLTRILDDDSVEHSLHAISDEGSVSAIQAFFRSRTLMVLDGTSWSSASRRMAYLVDAADSGLFASPMHRVYRGPRNVDPAKLEEILAPDFQCEHLPWSGGDAASALLAAYASDHHAFILRWKASDEIILARAPHGTIRNVSCAAAGSIPPDGTVLEQVIEERLRSLALDVSSLAVRDAHNTMDVLDHLDDGRFAILANPCEIDDLWRIASTGGQVPPRSILFLPRLCCGLISMPLHGW